MTQVSDRDWQPLRDAVPSFADAWASEIREPGYDPEEAGGNLSALTFHLVRRAAADNWTEFPALFAAIETLYARAEAKDWPELEEFLTIGLLEDLIYGFQHAGLDPLRLAPYAIGERTRAGWAAAYRYVHPES